MNRKEVQTKPDLEDAELLYRSWRFDGAYYLSGYVTGASAAAITHRAAERTKACSKLSPNRNGCCMHKTILVREFIAEGQQLIDALKRNRFPFGATLLNRWSGDSLWCPQSGFPVDPC